MARRDKRSPHRFDQTCPSALVGLAVEPIVNERIKTIVAGGLLSLGLLGVARAGRLQDAEAAYQRHDDATTLQILVDG